MNKSTPSPAPLFMVAQLPFNQEDTVKLNTPMTEIMNDQGNLQVTLKNLKELGVGDRILSPDIRFLEIGCGRGYLLSHLYRTGQGEYLGIEPITSQYTIALNKLLESGNGKVTKASIRRLVKSTDLEKTHFAKGSLDYIYSYHVIEHLQNPLVMLDCGKKWLKPGGRMIITCPNVEGYFPSHDLPNWRCSISSHRWLPGLSTLCRALNQSGYTVEKYFTYGGYPSPRTWKKTIINRWLKFKHRGDVMCIMARSD